MPESFPYESHREVNVSNPESSTDAAPADTPEATVGPGVPQQTGPQPLDVIILERTLDSFWRPWMGVVGVLVVLVVLAINVTPYWLPSPDSGLYLDLGRSLAAGKGYQVDGIPHTLAFPGLPLMLAAVYRTLGENFFVMNLIETLMGVGCVLLTIVLLRRWVGIRLAVVIGLLTGMTETLVRYSARVLTDIPHLFFSLLSLVLIEEMWMQRSSGRRVLMALLVGCSVTVACMLRPTGLVLIPVALVALFWRRYSLMKLREKILALLIWAAAIGGPLSVWELYVSGVDAAQRRTYVESSVLLRGITRLLAHMQNNSDQLPGQLAETLARNHFGVVLNVILLLVIVLGLVRLARRGAWHLTLYTVLGTGLLFIHCFQRRYLLAMLPFAFAGLLLGTARLFSFGEERHPTSRTWRTWASVTLIVLMLGFPLVNAFPIAKLTHQKYQRPFYQKYDDGRWNDEIVLGEWMRNNTPPDTVFWTHYTSVLSYLSQRTVRGPETPYRGMNRTAWQSTTELLENLSHWKPDYLIVDTTTSRRRVVEKLVKEGRINVVRVLIDGIGKLRVYRFQSPARFQEEPAQPPAVN